MASLQIRPKMVDIKSTSNAIWWIKNPFTGAALRRQKKGSIGKSICHDVADLFRNISIHGYSKLFLPEFSIWEKLIWLAVHTTTLFALVTVLSLTWEQFVAQYFAISLHDPLYPVENVPFPAVSICSNNRISRRAALEYAYELKRKHPRDYPIEYFLENIAAFTNMYYKFGREGVIERYDSFQTFLDTYDTWDNETFYNTKRALRRVTMLQHSCMHLKVLTLFKIQNISTPPVNTITTPNDEKKIPTQFYCEDYPNSFLPGEDYHNSNYMAKTITAQIICRRLSHLKLSGEDYHNSNFMSSCDSLLRRGSSCDTFHSLFMNCDTLHWEGTSCECLLRGGASWNTLHRVIMNWDTLRQKERDVIIFFGEERVEIFFLGARYRLTPSCKDFLLKCSLAGVDIDCMSKTAFQNIMTVYGPCCTFNWDDIYTQRKHKDSFVAPDMGLTVMLNTSQSDNFSPILNIYGSMVIIHTPGDFADTASGGCRVVFPAYGEESFIALKARIIDSVEDLRAFSPKTRNCYFDNEVIKSDILLRSSYSFTNCITRCRISSMLALCKCLPFYMPLDLVDRLDGVIYCTLQHISCLLRYSFKWNNVLTQRSRIPGLEREMEDALFCAECLPSCDDVQYHASLMSLPVDRFRSSINLDNTTKYAKDDISVVRIHFEDPHMQFFRRVVVNAWFEALSTVGNICGIFIGFSMVAIGEILYYALKYVIMTIKIFVQQNNKQSKKKQKLMKLDTLDEKELYICP